METLRMEATCGIVAKLANEGITYRHYRISQHAIQRFTERLRVTIDKIFPALDRAVIADARQAKDHRVMDQIKRAERQGGYCLLDPDTETYFFIALGAGKYHTISTVMTFALLTYTERK
ncbi:MULTISPECIES: hypothetical protein [unclassified Leclercia]|uniref:Uncharacterized protein n=1 Tax=Leclercia barmai TaxID=2785629 RepID=A0ABS7RZ64_9ENTR|nr:MULTISPECIES: hypothetical protein [unclassified Leclercia]MBZ0059609.1 hypothetical protein [Leclercia sp. EMC7]MCM5697258.1 hypothetical protein [Leclercia sp. LTM01]MCM5702146.1 hypothetical protein [Leclercia sp. LTM14]